MARSTARLGDDAIWSDAAWATRWQAVLEAGNGQGTLAAAA
jgi:hypothetical protein